MFNCSEFVEMEMKANMPNGLSLAFWCHIQGTTAVNHFLFSSKPSDPKAICIIHGLGRGGENTECKNDDEGHKQSCKS